MHVTGLVLGVGVHSKGKYAGYVGGVATEVYKLWINMLTRCYSEKYLKTRPTYLGCSVSDNFKDFQYFAEWCNTQIGFGLKDYQLDKDVLFKGNKVYSEDTCVFVPRQINMILVDNVSRRGDYPLGVSYKKKSGRYLSTFAKYGENQYLGYFDTPEEAHFAYKREKEAWVKDVAEKFRTKIDERVYMTLTNWEVKCQ